MLFHRHGPAGFDLDGRATFSAGASGRDRPAADPRRGRRSAAPGSASSCCHPRARRLLDRRPERVRRGLAIDGLVPTPSPPTSGTQTLPRSIGTMAEKEKAIHQVGAFPRTSGWPWSRARAQGRRVCVLDLRELSSFTDFFSSRTGTRRARTRPSRGRRGRAQPAGSVR